MAEPKFFDRVVMRTKSITPGTSNISLRTDQTPTPDATVETGFRGFADVLADNDYVQYLVEALDAAGAPSGAWERGICQWDEASTNRNLERSSATVLASSNSGSLVNFNVAGIYRVCIAPPSAERFAYNPDKCEVRVSLSSGNAVYRPNNAIEVTLHDNTDQADATAHGWETGTVVRVLETITDGTDTLAKGTYFIKNQGTNSISFHTTAAAAIAGTPWVQLPSGDPDPKVWVYPIGKAHDTLRILPFDGHLISLWTGNRWKDFSFSEISENLSGSTGNIKDVFLYYNTSTSLVDAELSSSWAGSSPSRAVQDGRIIKSGDATRRWVATVLFTDTNVVELSARTAGIYNAMERNRLPWAMDCFSFDDSWTTGTGSIDFRSFNGSGTPEKVTVVAGEQRESLQIQGSHLASFGADGKFAMMGIGVGDGVTNVNSASPSGVVGGQGPITTPDPDITVVSAMSCGLSHTPSIGKTEYIPLEATVGGTATVTFYSLWVFARSGGSTNDQIGRRSGLSTTWNC